MLKLLWRYTSALRVRAGKEVRQLFTEWRDSLLSQKERAAKYSVIPSPHPDADQREQLYSTGSIKKNLRNIKTSYLPGKHFLGGSVSTPQKATIEK